MRYLILIFSIILSGCTTIHFDKEGEPSNYAVANEKWHHNVAYSLFEISSPVNLEQRCGEKEWVSVKTETSFINGIASLAGYIIPGGWDPKTTTVACE